MHDGVAWAAIVGKQLRGTKTTYQRGRESRTHRSDPAIVLGIFPSEPYKVVTDGHARSESVNPFMAGGVRGVRRFQPQSIDPPN